MAITATERTEIEKLLVLMFNAAPGATYLSQVVNIYETLGHNLGQLANNLDDIPVFQQLHPNFQTAAEFAADFLTPLGLQNDALAKSFVLDKFNAGVPKGEIMYEGMLALEGVTSGAAAQYVAAKAILDNKTAVSEYYSVTKNVDQTDLNVLQLVLNGVTADTATVTAAETGINNGTLGTAGIEVTLSPSQDTVVGTTSSDTINGLFGDAVAANNTFTAGDSIDGAAGSDRLNLVALGTTASQAITVKNVEAINIQDTIGATFNALLAENNPGISFTSTVTGNTSMVTNASTGSTFGLAGKGNLTVDFTSTSGSADTAKVVLNGVGTSSTAPSTVNVADGNTVEKVTVDTAGTNFVKLTGGSVAASLVITGSGTNTFSLSAGDSLAAVAAIDASASTGTNTFALGGNLNTGTTIKGGTGADTVSATLAAATLTAPAISGVETLSTTFTAAAVVDLGSATGLTTITASDKGAAATTMTFQNAQSTVTGLTVSNVDATAIDSVLKFGYASASKGDLAFKIGSTSATATAVDLGAVTISNVNSLKVTTLGALDHDLNSMLVKGNLSTLDFNVAAGGGLTTGGTDVTGTIGAINITTGAGSFYSGAISGGAGKDIGNVTLTATGTGSELQARIFASGDAGIGNISYTATGNQISGYLTAYASGSIGDVTVSITGDANDFNYHVSGAYISANAGPGILANLGDLTINVTGDDNRVSGSFDAGAGSIGNINVTVTGDGNDVNVSAGASHEYWSDGTSNNVPGGDYYTAGGGNVGDVTVNVNGDSYVQLDVDSSGGVVGNFNVSADNGGVISIDASSTTANWYSGAPDNAGSIGNITVTVGKDSAVYTSGGSSTGYGFSAAGGDIGNISVAVTGDNGSGGLFVHASNASGSDDGSLDSDDYNHGGNVGDISVSVDGDNASYWIQAYASGGSIGNVDFAINGDNASGWMRLYSNWHQSGSTGGDIGNVNITLNDDAGFWFGYSIDGTMGPVTVTGGDNVTLYISGGGGYTPGTAYNGNAVVTSTSVSLGDDAYVYSNINGFSGSVGATTGSFGSSAEDYWYYSTTAVGVMAVGSHTLTYGSGADTVLSFNNAATIGAVTYTAGASSDVSVTVTGTTSSMGKETFVGGDSASSVTVTATGAISSMGGVDASAWLGTSTIDLSGVTPTGTTIRVGAAGSTVTGTEGADNVFLGAGKDTVNFDASPTATDVIFSYTAGAGKDVLNVPLGDANFVAAPLTVNPGAGTAYVADTVVRLIDIAAGQDITTAAGLTTALAAAGEYANVTGAASTSSTIITAASATASTFYVFDATDSDANGTYDVVTLVGVVNGTAAGAIGSLVAANIT